MILDPKAATVFTNIKSRIRQSRCGFFSKKILLRPQHLCLFQLLNLIPLLPRNPAVQR